MKTYSSKISIDALCNAICQVYKKYDDNVYDFIARLQKQSTKCIWIDICRIILCNVDDRTIKKYQKKCYDVFKQHCNYIVENVYSCIAREQMQESEILDLSENKDVITKHAPPYDNLPRGTSFLAPFPRNVLDSSQSKDSKDDQHLLLSVLSECKESTHGEHDSSSIIHSDEHLLLPDSLRSKGREDHERVSSPIIGNDKHPLISDRTNYNIPFSKVQTGEYFKNDIPIEVSLYEKAGLMHSMLNLKNNIHFAF